MADYLFMVDIKNWEIVREKNVMGLGVDYQNFYNHIELEARCLIYITKIASIGGIFEIISKNPEKIHWNTGNYNNLFQLKPIYVPESPVSIKPYLEKLYFVHNKSRWFTHFFKPKRIPEIDVNYLLEKLNQR